MSDLIPIPSPAETLYFGPVGAPLIILVHDYFGRLPWLENMAAGFEHQGYRVAIPDLYNGVATIDRAAAAGLMQQLDVPNALAELDGIVKRARSAGSQRVGVVGFSMGGWLALLHAEGGNVEAVASYYATLESQQHGVIPCPVLLQFAEADTWGVGGDPHSFIGRLKEHGTPVTEFTYVGAKHSFANASIDETFEIHAATLAFARTSSFFEDHLSQ
jgi:carboxymethylenebutenolidase